MNDFKPKSFWEKPEGTTGMLVAAGAVVGGGFALYKFLPFIVVLLDNLFHTILLGLGIAAVSYVVIDPRMRNLLFWGYSSIMRGVTGVFITIDPIGIIETYVDTLKDNLKKIGRQTANVRGQIESLNGEIKTNKRKMEENFSIAQAAKKSGNSKYAMNAKLAMRSSGRLQKSSGTLKELLVKLEGLYRTLNKTEETAKFLISDIEDEIQIKKRERKAILAGHSAIKSAMKIIKPEDDKRLMFDRALEFMAEDIGNKVGDIEHFMEISEEFMNGVDLQNGICEEDGWNLLESWEQEESALLGDEKTQILKDASNDFKVLDLDNTHTKVDPSNRKSQFKNLF